MDNCDDKKYNLRVHFVAENFIHFTGATEQIIKHFKEAMESKKIITVQMPFNKDAIINGEHITVIEIEKYTEY